MSTLIIFGENPEIDFLEFDATPVITHVDAANVTEHAVEEGANISDHIRKLPAELRLEAVVTDSPIVFARSISEPADRPQVAYEILLDILDAKQLIQVITSKRSYDNMALRSVGMTRTASDGDGLRFALAFRELRIVESETTDAVATKPAAGDRAEGTAELGAQAAPAAGAAEAAGLSSLLSDLLGAF